MNKKQAWKVEQKLIDRFLNVLTDNGFKWLSGHRANKYKYWNKNWNNEDLMFFIETEPKTITYLRNSDYLNEPVEELDIIEVTEELLDEMEYVGVVSTLIPERLRKDIWKLICGMEECEDDEDELDEEDRHCIHYDEFHDPVNHPSHYNHGGIETITIIQMLLTEEEYRGYLKGNILKYRERGPYKGNAEEDYAKAKWYFDELMTIGF